MFILSCGRQDMGKTPEKHQGSVVWPYVPVSTAMRVDVVSLEYGGPVAFFLALTRPWNPYCSNRGQCSGSKQQVWNTTRTFESY